MFVKFSSCCAIVLIFLSQFVPTAYIGLKACVLIIGILCIFIEMVCGKVSFQYRQLLGILLITTFGLLYSFYGVLRGNPGAVRVLSVILFWPMIYLLFSTLLRQPTAFYWLKNVFITALITIVGYGFLYLGNVAGIVPDYYYFAVDQGQDAGFYDGYVEYSMYSISSLIFLIPFYSHYLLERYKQTDKLHLWSLLILICSVFLGVLTGRRAVFLVLLLMPFVIWFSNRFLLNYTNFNVTWIGLTKSVVVMSFLAGFLFFAGIQYDLIADMFIDGFNFSSSVSSAGEREAQFHSLVDGWYNSSLLFGSGNGAAASISRSHEFPWAYELTYVYLLFSTGIVGVLVYFGWYFYSFWRLREAIRQRPDLIIYAAPILTGSVSFCIAAATNPYFGKFDYLWVVLIPFFISGYAKFQCLVKTK